MDKNASIYVAGHTGLVGSAIMRALMREGFDHLVLYTREELDLRNQRDVDYIFSFRHPDYVFLAAAKVGGILANSNRPADFIRDNLLIQTNVIDAAHKYGVKKLLFLGSSCIYPRDAKQPIREEELLSGPLEPTNDAYAIAKIAGIRMLRAYREQFGFCGISIMPCNLYGPRDNFDLESSHVLPALIRKFHGAKVRGDASVEIWGTGTPRREFLHVDDLADAALMLLDRYDESEIINVGAGHDIAIYDLAQMVKRIVGYDRDIRFDTDKPDGTPRKILNSMRINVLGWKPKISLEEGIRKTYEWFTSSSLQAANLQTTSGDRHHPAP